MTLNQKAGQLVANKKVKRNKLHLFTVFGKLVSPHYIKTSNRRYYRLSERRDDDLNVDMYWLLQLTKYGKYEVLRRIDPRYCEPER